MHLEYKPGDLAMFDHAGKRMHIGTMDTGETTPCECFVSTLPYSVPYIQVGSKVRVLFDEKTVEVYLDNSRQDSNADASVGITKSASGGSSGPETF